MVRLCGALVTPLRLLGSVLIVIGFVALGSKNDGLSVVGLPTGIGLLVLARLFRGWRWPPLSRYLRDPANQVPRDWHPDDARSDGSAAWCVVRGVVEPWIKAHRNPLNRGATRREALQDLSTGSRTRHIADDKVSLQDLAGPCDALTSRLSPAEVVAVRRDGVLPSWFWDDLAGYAGTLS